MYKSAERKGKTWNGIGKRGEGERGKVKKGIREGRSTIIEGNLVCEASPSTQNQSLDYSGPLLLNSVVHPVGKHLCPAHLSVLRVIFCNDSQLVFWDLKMQSQMVPVHHLIQVLHQLL